MNIQPLPILPAIDNTLDLYNPNQPQPQPQAVRVAVVAEPQFTNVADENRYLRQENQVLRNQVTDLTRERNQLLARIEQQNQMIINLQQQMVTMQTNHQAEIAVERQRCSKLEKRVDKLEKIAIIAGVVAVVAIVGLGGAAICQNPEILPHIVEGAEKVIGAIGKSGSANVAALL